MPESPKDPIELLIQGRAHELGPGFPVRRVLPSVKRRTVGPFIFLDHFGPMTVPPGGDGMAVRPHPHIGLATVTYLFDGGIFHRDSLGYALEEPTSLNVLPLLPRLIDMGVAAIKVEGRQRSPAYVTEVTRTLRAAKVLLRCSGQSA